MGHAVVAREGQARSSGTVGGVVLAACARLEVAVGSTLVTTAKQVPLPFDSNNAHVRF